jgi:hypothetical protein
MVEDVAEKTSKGFDSEQYWAPSSHRPWHIILIPLFLGWLGGVDGGYVHRGHAMAGARK